MSITKEGRDVFAALGFNITDDESIERSNSGEIIFFSVERFITDIVKNRCCFICGAAKGSKPFNDEHVIPNWILSEFSLHNETITLPNGTTIAYGKYKISCCAECNSFLGDIYESIVSNVLRNGYDAVVDFVKNRNGRKVLFCWMALLFIKHHLKDLELPVERDQRKGNGKSIADEHHDFSELHHIHCLARAPYSAAHILPDVYGSLLVLKADGNDISIPKQYDYSSSSEGKAMMIRIHDCCIFAVLNDCGASLQSMVANQILKPNLGPLSYIQSKEIHTHFAYNNIVLVSRPIFGSGLSRDGTYYMSVDLPTPHPVFKHDSRLLSFMKHYVVSKVFENDIEVLRRLEAEEPITYLYNDDGTFNTKSIRLERKTP